jgi:hypothetical protein
MITRPRGFEESSSSDLSGCESPSTRSEFSATSPMQDTCSTVEEALTAIHPTVTRRKKNKQNKQNTPSPCRKESTGKHRMVTRGKRLVQVAQRNSSLIEQSTPREHSVRPRKQATPHRELTPTPPRSPPSEQGTFSRQKFNALLARFPNPQQFYAPQNGISAQQQFVPNHENPVISDVSGIDPSLLSLIFKEADTISPNLQLPPGPILLNIGEPIRIPIWEFRSFRRFDASHEEPSDLALSDNEGGTGVTITSERTPLEKGEATKYPYNIRKPFEWRRKLRKPHKARDSRKPTSKHSPVKVRSPRKARSPIKERTTLREPTPIKGREFNDEQTRFMILMRAYWGKPHDEIAEALNREFEGDNQGEPWSANQVAKRLGDVEHDPMFEEYRKGWEDARVFRFMSRRG